MKTEAIVALSKKKDLDLAKSLLRQSATSYEWAGLTSLQSGIKAVEKDCESFESKYKADMALQAAVTLSLEKKTPQALAKTQEALTLYKGSKSVQAINDVAVVTTMINCLEAQLSLQGLSNVILANDGQTRASTEALQICHDAQEIFSSASNITNSALVPWVDYMSTEHALVTPILTFIKAWIEIEDLFISETSTQSSIEEAQARLQETAANASQAAALIQKDVLTEDVVGSILNTYCYYSQTSSDGLAASSNEYDINEKDLAGAMGDLTFAPGAGVLVQDDGILDIPNSAPPSNSSQVYDVNFDDE